MKSIREVVQQAIDTGYLSREAEEALRRMLRMQYGDDELEAFVRLQRAAMTGQVRQESREALVCQL